MLLKNENASIRLDFVSYEFPETEYGMRSEEHRVGKECRSEEHTSELQSRKSISYAVFCLKKKFF